MSSFIENIDLSFLTVIQRYIATTDSFDLILKATLIYIAFFWLSLVVWVTKDVINRSNSIIFQSFSILLNTFLPIFGLIIYLLIRPSKTLLDKYYDDLELKSLSMGKFCPKCSNSVSDDFEYCPECGLSLKNDCNSCKKQSFKDYKICPFCGEKKNKKIEKKEPKKEKSTKKNKKK